MLLSFWETYNTDFSFWPLYLPLLLWTVSYFYARASGFAFHRWHALHDLHNFGAIGLGFASLFFNNDSLFNERIGILWSVGYFFVDCIDCLIRSDYTYLFHGVACLFLGLTNYSTPICRSLRMNSKATMCELSNPFMHVAKRTGQPWHFALFAVVYTLCRIIWIPIMMKQVRAELEWADYRMIALMGFYGLNLFWYAKIIRIIVEGNKGSTAKTEAQIN